MTSPSCSYGHMCLCTRGPSQMPDCYVRVTDCNPKTCGETCAPCERGDHSGHAQGQRVQRASRFVQARQRDTAIRAHTQEGRP